MKQHTNGFVGSRVLKLNVGFLLSAGPGHTHDTEFDAPSVRIAPDVDVTFIKGTLRLSRAKEGILVRGRLNIGVEDECYRCVDPVQREMTIDVEELFTHPIPRDAEFSIDDDGILDLAPLLRAEILIADGRGVLCKPDCKGLCPNCGANLNRETCQCEEEVDPRLAKLKELLNK